MEWVPSLRHSQHACSPTVAGNVKSHYLCCPSYPSPSFLCILLMQLNPRTFLPLFVSYSLSNSNGSFSSFFLLLWQKSSSLNWLLLAPMATTLPLYPPSPLKPPTNRSLNFSRQFYPSATISQLPPSRTSHFLYQYDDYFLPANSFVSARSHPQLSWLTTVLFCIKSLSRSFWRNQILFCEILHEAYWKQLKIYIKNKVLAPIKTGI